MRLENDSKVGQLIFTHPGNNEMVDTLAAALGIDKAQFDESIKLYGEATNLVDADFQPRLLTDGKPNLSKIQGVIRDLLQSQSDLAVEAAKMNGAFKPIVVPNDLAADRMNVLTEWQQLAGNDNLRLYWRANIRLERRESTSWILETVIDFGERYRSQSFEQIEKMSDSNRLLAFESLNATLSDNAKKIRYKTVVSPTEELFTPETSAGFRSLAPKLWTSIKKAILRPDYERP